MGISACFGPFQSKQAFEKRVLGYEREITPAQPRNWWGIAESNWFKSQGWNTSQFPGFLSRLAGIRARQVSDSTQGTGRDAAAAVVDAQGGRRCHRRCAVGFASGARGLGVLVGIGLDLNTTNFHLRWSMAEESRTWNESLRLELAGPDLTSWTDELKRSAGPALTANRTMGSLGGLIASRIRASSKSADQALRSPATRRRAFKH